MPPGKVPAFQKPAGERNLSQKALDLFSSIGTRDKAHGVAGIGRASRTGLPISGSRLFPVSGGRTWWAHFVLTRINIEPIILRKKIEDVREVGASMPIAS